MPLCPTSSTVPNSAASTLACKSFKNLFTSCRPCVCCSSRCHSDPLFSYGLPAVHRDHLFTEAIARASGTSNHSLCCVRHCAQYIQTLCSISSACTNLSTRCACGTSWVAIPVENCRDLLAPPLPFFNASVDFSCRESKFDQGFIAWH